MDESIVYIHRTQLQIDGHVTEHPQHGMIGEKGERQPNIVVNVISKSIQMENKLTKSRQLLLNPREGQVAPSEQ